MSDHMGYEKSKRFDNDAILYSVRDNGIISKLAAYVILGVNQNAVKKF